MKYTVRGTRVILTPPVIKESSIEVDEKLKKEILEEQMKKWTRLDVFAIGEEVTGIEVGNQVFVNPLFIRNAENIEIDGQVKIIVRAADVSVVWK